MTTNNLASRVFLISSISIFSSTPVFAFCVQTSLFGSEPSFFRSSPSVPYCLSAYSYTGSHTCSSWEVDSYLDDVNDYIDALNDFVREAQAFAESAQSFAEDALNYAVCEAEEVKTQHE